MQPLRPARPRLWLSAVAILVPLLGGTPSTAAAPGTSGHATRPATPPGRIALTRGNPSEIWLVDHDGSRPVQVTNSPGARQPSWSPDGQSIAFVAPGSAGGDAVWVISGDGTGLRQVNHGMRAEHPAWSPDGTSVAFDSVADGAVWVAPLDGATPVKLTGGLAQGHRDREPAWSLDGSHVAFVRSNHGGPWVLYTMSLLGVPDLGRGNVNQGVSSPAWMADQEVALVLGHGAKRRVVYGNRPLALTAVRPSWNPMFIRGASEIAFLTTRGDHTSLDVSAFPSQKTAKPATPHVLIASVVGSDLAWQPPGGPCLSHDAPGRITCQQALTSAQGRTGTPPAPPVATYAFLVGHRTAWEVRFEGYADFTPSGPGSPRYPCWSGTTDVVLSAATGKVRSFGWDVFNVPCLSASG